MEDGCTNVILATFTGGHSEGTVNFTSSYKTVTLSHGQWKRTGECTFIDTDTVLRLGADGKVNATITFHVNIKVDPAATTPPSPGVTTSRIWMALL
ncbi:MAG: hypothetical protein ACRDQU_21225 [Pseudonocardiaceae bacterium]